MKDNENLILFLDNELGNPSEVMNLIHFDTSITESFKLIVLGGLMDKVICYLRDEDGLFSEKTLTNARNIELIQSYLRYVTRLNLTIDELFVMSFGSNIHNHWGLSSGVPLSVIRNQIKEIAKPFYNQKNIYENDNLNNINIRKFIEVPELDYSKIVGREFPISSINNTEDTKKQTHEIFKKELNKRINDLIEFVFSNYYSLPDTEISIDDMINMLDSYRVRSEEYINLTKYIVEMAQRMKGGIQNDFKQTLTKDELQKT